MEEREIIMVIARNASPKYAYVVNAEELWWKGIFRPYNNRQKVSENTSQVFQILEI